MCMQISLKWRFKRMETFQKKFIKNEYIYQKYILSIIENSIPFYKTAMYMVFATFFNFWTFFPSCQLKWIDLLYYRPNESLFISALYFLRHNFHENYTIMSHYLNNYTRVQYSSKLQKNVIISFCSHFLLLSVSRWK